MSLVENFFQPYLANAIQASIGAGVPATYFSYLLVLPFLASMIAVARHLFGLATYGTFLPVVFSLLWAEVGLDWGVILTVFLYLWSWLARFVLKKTLVGRFRINYLPRMAILLMLIGLGVLFLGLLPGWQIFTTDAQVVFPLVLLIVMMQNMLETQISLSKKEAREMLWETLGFSLLGYLFFVWTWLGELVITYPGATIIITFLFNLLVGRFLGFRLLEYRKFKTILTESSSKR